MSSGSDPREENIVEVVIQLIHSSREASEQRRILRDRNLSAYQTIFPNYTNCHDSGDYMLNTFQQKNIDILDNGVRINNKLVKDLRNLSAENKCRIIQRINKTNMRNFLDGALHSIMIAICDKKKPDISAAIQVVSVLHQRYFGVSARLIEQIQRFFRASTTENNGNYFKVQRRVLLLLTEMYIVGMIPDAEVVICALHRCARHLQEANAFIPLFKLTSDFLICAGVDLLNLRPAWTSSADHVLKDVHAAQNAATSLLARLNEGAWGLTCIHQKHALQLQQIVMASINKIMPWLDSTISDFQFILRSFPVCRPSEMRRRKVFCSRLAALQSVTTIESLNVTRMGKQIWMLILADAKGSAANDGHTQQLGEEGLYADEPTRAMYQARRLQSVERTDGKWAKIESHLV
jgi:hypothetical protein